MDDVYNPEQADEPLRFWVEKAVEHIRLDYSGVDLAGTQSPRNRNWEYHVDDRIWTASLPGSRRSIHVLLANGTYRSDTPEIRNRQTRLERHRETWRQRESRKPLSWTRWERTVRPPMTRMSSPPHTVSTKGFMRPQSIAVARNPPQPERSKARKDVYGTRA